MSIPTTRQEFAAFIIRQLSGGVTEVNLSETALDDAIDRALYFWQEWHYNGSMKFYYSYLLTPTDVTNKYITMPENIIGAVRIFPIGQAISSDALFNMRYQFIMNDLYSLTNVSLVPYYMTMQHISLLEEVLVGQQPIRYNRHQNQLWIDCDWTIMCPGTYIVVECQQAMDPIAVPDVWRDRWVQDYATALAGQLWGRVLSKYDVVLPSGMKLDGKKILDDYTADVRRLESTVPMMTNAVFMA
jgi:hypothetical protein